MSLPTQREKVAKEYFDGSGVGYFNPYIGGSPAETCGRVADALGFLYGVLFTNDIDFEQSRHGLGLMVQTIWAATQFEGLAEQSGEVGDHGA